MNTLAENLMTSGRTWTIEELDRLIETTLSGNIGGYPKRMGGIAKNDPTMGGRTRVWGKRHRVTLRGPELNR